MGVLLFSGTVLMSSAASATQPPPPPPSGKKAPPAPAAAGGLVGEAEANYKKEDFETAAIQFHKISSGEIPSSPMDQSRARFWLGKTLQKIGFYSAALSIFDEIVEAGEADPYYKLTLPWLASLGRELPEGAGVLDKIGRYKASDLEDEAFDDVRDELYYLLGRFFYHKGDLEQGVALLEQVPETSDYYIKAQFFLGVGYTREFKGEPAVGAFKNVLRRSIALEAEGEPDKAKKRRKAKGKVELKLSSGRNKKKRGKTTVELAFEDEMRRYQHLAAMGLGNIFYTVGKFDTALKYFDKIPLDSAYWLDSVFWSAWAEFRKVEIDPDNANRYYQRTLGHVHTINAPFFHDYLYPEVLKLKAVTYYFNCRYDSAKQTVDEFNRRYPKTKSDLQGVLDKAGEDFQLFELAVKIREGESDLDPFVESVAEKALRDKTLERYFEYVDELDREMKLYEEMSEDFKRSSAGERVIEDLDGAGSLAKEAAGAEARKRLQAQVREIKALEVEMIKVEYEILEKRKAQAALEDVPKKPLKPKIDKEHEIYNYNGEYWQDELGYYRYQVTNLCKD